MNTCQTPDCKRKTEEGFCCRPCQAAGEAGLAPEHSKACTQRSRRKAYQ